MHTDRDDRNIEVAEPRQTDSEIDLFTIIGFIIAVWVVAMIIS